ncbi:hypothetical protein ABZ499_34080 [Streptomyces sp. NPDC019990]|uniref:hypothetical protein n=1 Tax=Streptomyces sp. NPDC019990 TaxID=3154693 RepID=UPI0033DFE496
MPLLGVEVGPGPAPFEVEGVAAGVPVDGDAVLAGADWAGGWFGLVVLGFWPLVVRVPVVGSVVLRGGVWSPGVVSGVLPVLERLPGVVFPGALREAVPSSGVALAGVRWVGIRPSGVLGVRPSAVPGIRLSGVGVGAVRGVVGDVGLGADAGAVPVVEGVTGVPAEGFLAAPELWFGLVGDEVPPEMLGLWCVPGVAPPVEGAVGDVGMADPTSVRPLVPAVDDSAVVGAALDCVGVLAARPSIWVLIEPPPGEDDVPPDDEGAGADCVVGDVSADTGEPPPECEGPDVPGMADDALGSARPGEVSPAEGSSKSGRDGPAAGAGREYGVSEEDAPTASDSGPESVLGPGPTFGAPMSLPPVSADMPLPMLTPGPLPLSVRGDVDESDPGETESVDEEPDDEDLEDEESELPAPSSPLPAPSPSDNPDGPSYPSTRPSSASRVRLPALCPRLSRTPSAKV